MGDFLHQHRHWISCLPKMPAASKSQNRKRDHLVGGWAYPSEKYESQWEGWHPIYEMEKNVWNHPPATYIGEGFFELSLLSLADNFCEERYFRDVMNWVTGAKHISCLAALRIVGNIGWAVATAVKNWPYIFAVTSIPSQRNSHHVCLVSIVLLNHVQSSSSQLLKMAI